MTQNELLIYCKHFIYYVNAKQKKAECTCKQYINDRRIHESAFDFQLFI